MRTRTTDDRTETGGATADDRDAMADVSHANPYTGSTLGDVFARGPAVADGGTDGSGVDERVTASDDGSGVDGTATMDEVDHTPRNGHVNDVWVRGGRGSGVADETGDEE
ncbi:hypothetical protein [Halorubrum sp. DTA98]|uniref:hypothetical protein n=1 Tax=Halorubrum sp. DTA98 TaxID=3402163 RepID=UPI003AAAD7B5